MGSAEPKAFVGVNGKSLLIRSLETIISSGVASTIVVAAPEEFLLRARNEIDSIAADFLSASGDSPIAITAVAGGADRIGSVQIALKHIGDADIVLVHDAARSMTPPEVFRRVVAAVRSGAEAVVPVLPMTDTVRRSEHRPVETRGPGEAGARGEPGARGEAGAPGESRGGSLEPENPWAGDPQCRNTRTASSDSGDGPNGWWVMSESGTEIDQNPPTVELLHGDLDRASLRRVQTPQGFRADTLRRAHEKYADDVAASGSQAVAATDDAGLVERLGVDVVAVDGDEEALKITYPLDLVLAEHIAGIRDEVGGPGGSHDPSGSQDPGGGQDNRMAPESGEQP